MIFQKPSQYILNKSIIQLQSHNVKIDIILTFSKDKIFIITNLKSIKIKIDTSCKNLQTGIKPINN